MNSTSSSYDLNLSTGLIPMSDVMLENNSTQPLITTTDIDLLNEEKHLVTNQDHSSSSNPLDNVPLESLPLNLTKKQKSLVSVYDNSNDGEQQQQTNPHSLPLVAILGRNQRTQAFRKRLLSSGFPQPILCDINSNEHDFNEKSTYVSYETFLHQSPSIVLITEHFTKHAEHFFNLTKQQLILDVREVKFSKNSSHSLLAIPECYQAFGNLSNWEIVNGTQRIGVAIEQLSPRNVIQFIQDLNCFSRGIYFVDQFTYNHEQIKSFRNCIFPFISTILVFTLCFILSMIEYRDNYRSYSHSDFLYRQASSITGATSLTLLSLFFFIQPFVELMTFIKKEIRGKFIQRWLQSRRYLAWYSLSFALLHVLFLLLTNDNLNQKFNFLPVFFGIVSLSVLATLSFVYFPWISERLLWREYHLLTSYLGPFGLLIALIHVFIHWKYDYFYHTNQRKLLTLKFLSMFLPFLVLLLRVIIYGMIYPINQLIHHRPRKSIHTKKDTALLP